MKLPLGRLLLLAFGALALSLPQVASAHPRSSYGRHRQPIYHAPSVHYDQVYHPEYLHWTPGRGVHTHGHYDVVPHYVPGHYDQWHRGHIDVNPRFHSY